MDKTFFCVSLLKKGQVKLRLIPKTKKENILESNESYTRLLYPVICRRT